MSTRRLRDPDVVMKEGHFGDKTPKIITSDVHYYSNTLSSMRGPVGIVPRSITIPPQQTFSMRSMKLLLLGHRLQGLIKRINLWVQMS
eukprot:scaffold30111_cov43-Cyclotella_meneghiniana.AAC.2